MIKTKVIFLIFIFTLISKVEGLVPVSYTCCYNFSYGENGTLLNGFENIPLGGSQLDDLQNLSNWSVGGTSGSAMVVDNVNFKIGNQGIMLISQYGNLTSWNRTFIDKTINNNFSNTNNFGIWLYVYNTSTLNNVNIYFSSTLNWSRYFTTGLSTLQPGWNKIIIDKSSFSNSGGESWNNLIQKIRIAIYPTTGSNTNVTLGDLEYNVTYDWQLGGKGDSLITDTFNLKEGQQGLKLISTTNNTYMDDVINNNFSTTKNFAIWIYIDNATNYNGMIMYLTSSGGTWNTYFYDGNWITTTGWNKLIFNKNNFINIGGENWNNVMNRIRLRLVPNTTNSNLNVTFDDLRTDIYGQKAKLILEFDGGLLGTYTNAFPILNKNNQNGTSFFITAWPGGLYMNVSNLHALQNGGWDIASNTVDHPDLTTLSDSQLTNELNDSYSWLVTNGFQKSAGFVAYPYGKTNNNVIDKTKKRYILGRAEQEENVQQHFTPDDTGIQYIQRLISTSNKSVQAIEDSINDTINSRLLGIVLFNNISISNPTNDSSIFLTSDLQKISNYIKNRNSDVDVITYSDYVIPNINNFTPIINKITRIFPNGTSILITKNRYDEYMPNIAISPSSDPIDINVTTYDQAGGGVKFNESSPNSSQMVSYIIGDRIPNWLYNINIYWINGTLYQNFTTYANNTGYISYSSAGFQDSRYQDIEGQAIDTSFSVNLPAGYTFLRFNASNSTVNNLNPDGQTSSQPFFNISNNGNINQSYILYLDSDITNITTYADLTNNFSFGRIQINTSTSTVIIPNLLPGNSQNVWMIADVNQAPPMNINKTLTLATLKTVPGFVSNNCDPSLWNHVWGEDQNLTFRLLLNTTYPCINVAGTIDSISLEDDGDYGINIHLDQQYSFLLNQSNINLAGGDLIIEIICTNSNSINTSTCNNFSQNYLMNNISNREHINITGSYITDQGSGGWNEIHPITFIGPLFLRMDANRTSYSNIGDVIQYTYTITNVGDVTMDGVAISDNKIGTIPYIGKIFPGQFVQCVSNYTISQNDINNGSFTNSAYISIIYNGTIANSNLVSNTIFKQ